LQRVIAGVIDAKGVAAGVGLLALLWSALGWFQVIDYNVNQIWGVDKPRSFLKGKLFALSMVAAIGGVAFVSWAATAAIGLVSMYTDVIAGSTAFWHVAVSGLSIFTNAAAFMVLYRFTPRRQIDLADVWTAALATALLWELTRRIVAFYLGHNDMISGYGPVDAAMALLFWVYVSSIIVLLGAELGYAIAKERHRLRPGEEMLVAAPPGEQPTPKFAPQVGRGFDDPNERETILGVAPRPTRCASKIWAQRLGRARYAAGPGWRTDRMSHGIIATTIKGAFKVYLFPSMRARATFASMTENWRELVAEARREVAARTRPQAPMEREFGPAVTTSTWTIPSETPEQQAPESDRLARPADTIEIQTPVTNEVTSSGGPKARRRRRGAFPGACRRRALKCPPRRRWSKQPAQRSRCVPILRSVRCTLPPVSSRICLLKCATSSVATDRFGPEAPARQC